jgi:hypothetical protein
MIGNGEKNGGVFSLSPGLGEVPGFVGFVVGGLGASEPGGEGFGLGFGDSDGPGEVCGGVKLPGCPIGSGFLGSGEYGGFVLVSLSVEGGAKGPGLLGGKK